jgi:hypothetical protein
MSCRRSPILAVAALLLLGAGPAHAGTSHPAQQDGDEPRYELRGDWRFERGGTYRFTERRGRVDGRSRAALRLGGCRIRRGTVVFRRYRFVRRDGDDDVWRGRIAFVRDGCRRVFVSSTIVVHSDLRFTETSRLDGRRQRPGRFNRVRPRVRAGDPVIGTWVRNNVGIVVTASRGDYEGRARESFEIRNGCVIPAGTLIWRITPLSPGIYDGSIGTFLSPRSNCRPGDPAQSRWRLSEADELVRESVGEGRSFLYQRG